MKVQENLIAEKKVSNLVVSTSKPQLVKQWLANPKVSRAINLDGIKQVNKDFKTANEVMFEHSITMAKIIASATEWYKSDIGQSSLKDAQLELSQLDFAMYVFGKAKAHYYRLMQVSKVTDEQLTEYKGMVSKSKGDSLSVMGLLDFINPKPIKVKEEKEISDVEIGEDGIVSAKEEKPKALPTAKVVCSFTFGELSVMVDDTDGCDVIGSYEDIAKAIKFLTNRLTRSKSESKVVIG
jgi:hypothetical protein